MNNNEPIVLGNVKKGKTGRPLLVLILFLFIGAVLIILPILNNYFDGYNIIELIKDGELISFIQNHEQYVNDKYMKDTKTTTTTTQNQEQEITYINKKTVIEYNNFNINNFVLSESNITYTINTSTNINFDKSNYYLILTKDNNKTYIKLTGEINGSEIYTFDFLTPLSTIVEVEGSIKEVSKTDYKNITLSSNDYGVATLTCNKNSEYYVYTFKNNNLISIQETYRYTKNDNEDFETIYQDYEKYSNNIELLGGTSHLLRTQSGFTLLNSIDLNTYNFSENINYNYYSLNTVPKIINFEMEAKGFDCK